MTIWQAAKESAVEVKNDCCSIISLLFHTFLYIFSFNNIKRIATYFKLTVVKKTSIELLIELFKMSGAVLLLLSICLPFIFFIGTIVYLLENKIIQDRFYMDVFATCGICFTLVVTMLWGVFVIKITSKLTD